MMHFEAVAKIAGELSSLKFFPTEKHGQRAIMNLIGRMATDEAQVRWLVTRMLDLFDEWPGPRTLRMVFCKRFKPADGIDIPSGFIEQYPNGIPDEKRLETPTLPALPPGHQFTADPQLEAAVEEAAVNLPKMPTKGRLTRAQEEYGKFLEEVATAPKDRQELPREQPTNPNYKPITKADIEEAVRQLRQQKKPN